MMTDLKLIIKNAEVRIKEYSELMKDIGMNKQIFDPNDEFVIWFRSYVRELLNEEKVRLKDMVEEQTHINQGLNPPSFYTLRKTEKPSKEELEEELKRLISEDTDNKNIFFGAINFIKNYGKDVS